MDEFEIRFAVPHHARTEVRDFGAALLFACLEQILANASELAHGGGTDEHIHELRVGLRRLRTLLGDLAFLVPQFAPRCDAALKHAFHALGTNRDRYTLVPALAAQMKAAGAPWFKWRDEHVPLAPGRVVCATEFKDVLLILLEASAERGTGLPPAELRRNVRKALNRLFKHAAADAARFRRLAPERRHALRKRMKRLRYAVELTEPLFPGKDTARFVARLKKVQAALGAYQDALTARALWQGQARRSPEAWFGVDCLTVRAERLEDDCTACCKEFVAKARPSWR